MSDVHGLRRAAERGITLGDVGQRIVLENDYVHVWEVSLAPGETIDFHIHRHPYLVISLGGGDNEIETIFGEKRMTREPLGETVFIDGMRPVHRLTNRAGVPYLSRLVELKHVTWEAEAAEKGSAEAPAAAMPADAAAALKEILVQTEDLEWADVARRAVAEDALAQRGDRRFDRAHQIQEGIGRPERASARLEPVHVLPLGPLPLYPVRADAEARHVLLQPQGVSAWPDDCRPDLDLPRDL